MTAERAMVGTDARGARPDLLVALVGHNPLPLLLMARALKPRDVLLVASKQTETVAERLCGLLQCSEPLVVAAANPAIAEVRAALKGWLDEWVGERDDSKPAVVFDVTGGTGLMKVGVWEELRHGTARRLDVQQVLYASNDGGAIVDAVSGRPLEGFRTAVTVRDVLASYGARMLDKTRWSGWLVDVERSSYWGTHETHQKWWKDVAGGSARSGGAASASSSPPAGGEWLEDACLTELYEAVKRQKADGALHRVHVALGCHVVMRGGDKCEEVDLVAVLGTRVVVVEAKSGTRGARGLRDPRARADMAHRFFGRYCNIVFVSPRRDAGTLDEVEESLQVADRRLRLVRTPEEYRKAMLELLGLAPRGGGQGGTPGRGA